MAFGEDRSGESETEGNTDVATLRHLARGHRF